MTLLVVIAFSAIVGLLVSEVKEKLECLVRNLHSSPFLVPPLLLGSLAIPTIRMEARTRTLEGGHGHLGTHGGEDLHRGRQGELLGLLVVVLGRHRLNILHQKPKVNLLDPQIVGNCLDDSQVFTLVQRNPLSPDIRLTGSVDVVPLE